MGWKKLACTRCAQTLRTGDDYYEVPGLGDYCPDCMEGLLAHWKRTEGDVVDRI